MVGRPKRLGDTEVVSVRIEREMYSMLKDIANLESTYSGRNVTALDLIRYACSFCYEDGERLREVFRRTREHINKRKPIT